MSEITKEQWDEMQVDYACGNADALMFNQMWCKLCHAVDDIIDGEKLNREGICWVLMESMLEFGENKFYQENSAELKGLIIQSVNTFLDSCRWENSKDELMRKHANVLRIYCDMVVDHVAFIASGRDFARLRHLSRKWRDVIWLHVNGDHPRLPATLEYWRAS